MSLYGSILDTIGNTPLVKINKLGPEGVNLYVKLESHNPMGSVKDRMAKFIIEQAEVDGKLVPGQTVIEATSGNTGISLAMVCAQKGYPLVVTMAENFSLERRKLLRYLGAKVVLTPASEKGSGMVKKAKELADKFGYFLCEQFENDANILAHFTTTGPEIVQALEGQKIDCFVSGFGTGGTLNGMAKYLKSHDRNIQIIAAEPDNAPVLSSNIPQPRDSEGQISGSHPLFRPHLMQGWSPDFISSITEGAVVEQLVDDIVPVSGADALAQCKALATREGILVGISSGATFAAALTIAKQATPGANIVCMLTDTGERYLSTPMFEDVQVNMNRVEQDLSMSTPGCQFVMPVSTAPTELAKPGKPEPLDEQTVLLFRDLVDNNEVLMFSLEWCEFCWSAKKLFKTLNIDCTSVDLDSVQFQKNNVGNEFRKILKNETSQSTIPQIYIAGTHLGGASDLFAAVEDGTFFDMLGAPSPNIDASVLDALLPAWVHPRNKAEEVA